MNAKEALFIRLVLRWGRKPLFWALVMTTGYVLLFFIVPECVNDLPAWFNFFIVLPVIPVMILFNTETPPVWALYTLVPLLAFFASWILAISTKAILKSCLLESQGKN